MTKNLILCTLQPQQIINDGVYTVDHLFFDSWIVEAAEFERLTGHTFEDVERHSYDTDNLISSARTPAAVREWTEDNPYEVEIEEIAGLTSIEDLRKSVADDLYDTVTNDRNARSGMVDEYVGRHDDAEVYQMYLDADLGADEEEAA
jgi:hypothetical protein